MRYSFLNQRKSIAVLSVLCFFCPFTRFGIENESLVFVVVVVALILISFSLLTLIRRFDFSMSTIRLIQSNIFPAGFSETLMRNMKFMAPSNACHVDYIPLSPVRYSVCICSWFKLKRKVSALWIIWQNQLTDQFNGIWQISAKIECLYIWGAPFGMCQRKTSYFWHNEPANIVSPWSILNIS